MRPKKKWGQNFLRNRGAAEKIVAAVEAAPDEVVVEIGPGEGVLTSVLVERYPGRVTAVEIDPALVASLRSRFGPALEVIEGDALEVPLPTRPFRAVGNLPYNAGTPILRRVIADPNFRRAVFMLQKEVADRLVAKPSTPAYGYLTLYTQVFASAKILMTLEPRSFYPPPKVRSAVVMLDPRNGLQDVDIVLATASASLRNRRKTLLNNLQSLHSRGKILAAFEQMSLPETVRAEQLDFAQFAKLSALLARETTV